MDEWTCSMGVVLEPALTVIDGLTDSVHAEMRLWHHHTHVLKEPPWQHFIGISMHCCVLCYLTLRASRGLASWRGFDPAAEREVEKRQRMSERDRRPSGATATCPRTCPGTRVLGEYHALAA